MRTQPTKFEYIVEDPFYSTIQNSFVRVDDNNNLYTGNCRSRQEDLHTENLTDGMIEVLYKEWFHYQLAMDIINGETYFTDNFTGPTV